MCNYVTKSDFTEARCRKMSREAASLQRLAALARRDVAAGAEALRRHCGEPGAADRLEAALGACAPVAALQLVASLDGAVWRPAGVRTLRRLWAASVHLLALAELEPAAPPDDDALRHLIADVGAGRFESTADLCILGYVLRSDAACERAAPLVVGAVYDGGAASLLALIEWSRHLPPQCVQIVADALLAPLERRCDAEQALHAWLWLRGTALDDARLQPRRHTAQLRARLSDQVRMRELLRAGRHAQDGLLASVADLCDGADVSPLLAVVAAAPEDYFAYALLDALHKHMRRHQQLHTFQVFNILNLNQIKFMIRF